jgi:hypothetical protein
MSVRSESVILCEGHHDRAFLKGWLEKLEFRNLATEHSSGPIKVYDPWDKPVLGGQFGFRWPPSDQFVRIVPCHGPWVGKIRRAAKNRLGRRSTEALDHLVFVVDLDGFIGDDFQEAERRRVESLAGLLRELELEHTKTDDNDFLIDDDDGSTHISIVHWRCDDGDGPGIPRKQTLERVVCASLAAVYPERAEAVQHWLDGRPDPPGESPSAPAWSFMAGWYPDYDCEAFYSELWNDAQVAEALTERLNAIGATGVMTKLMQHTAGDSTAPPGELA